MQESALAGIGLQRSTINRAWTSRYSRVRESADGQGNGLDGRVAD